MLIAQRINDFVTSKRGAAVCDGCIIEAVGLTKLAHSNQITVALGTTSDFTRERGQCSKCHNERLVIRANRS